MPHTEGIGWCHPICWDCILQEEEEEEERSTKCSSVLVLFERTAAAEDDIRQSRGGGHPISIACHSGFRWSISILLHKLTKSRLVMLRHDMTHTLTHTVCLQNLAYYDQHSSHQKANSDPL